MKTAAVLSFLLMICLYSSAQVPPAATNKADSLSNANLKNVDSLNKADTLKVVEILSAERYGYLKKDSLNEILLLVGKVALKQENTIFYADSAIYNRYTKIVEAFKNVHINDNDSVNAYSDYLLYHTDTKIAFLKKKVRLTDGKSNLYTEELEYDVNQKVSIYRKGGRVVNSTSVLTSKEGIYYTDLKDIYFKYDVKLKDPQYKLESDSLLYNTVSEIATFISKTYIEDSAKRTIETSEGFYDLKNKNASFGKRPIIKDGPMIIIANQVDTDDKSGISILTGNAVFKDTSQGVSVLANLIISNRNTGSMIASQHPLMIIKQETDSTFITADTLYSGRLSELPEITDTITRDSSISKSVAVDSLAKDSSVAKRDSLISEPIVEKDTPKSKRKLKRNASIKDGGAVRALPKINPEIKGDSSINDSIATPNVNTVAKKSVTQNPNDSTDRFFRAYYNVRIFSDSLQAVSDSLFYSGKDSIFRLFKDPVVWSGNSQVTGDTIYMYTKNKKPKELYVFENGLMVNKTGEDMYNQIKGNRLFGYFKEGEIDNIRAKGNAESIYYAMDNEDKIVGINKATSDIIDMRFKNKELNRVVFISAVTGTMLPFRQATEEDRRLRNFKWHEDRRPKSKFELFGN